MSPQLALQTLNMEGVIFPTHAHCLVQVLLKVVLTVVMLIRFLFLLMPLVSVLGPAGLFTGGVTVLSPSSTPDPESCGPVATEREPATQACTLAMAKLTSDVGGNGNERSCAGHVETIRWAC